MMEIEQTIAVLFMDDTDLIINGQQDIIKMQKILSMYDRLFGATNRLIATDKSTYFSQRWHQK